MSDVGCRMWDVECWALVFGFWNLDFGAWDLDLDFDPFHLFILFILNPKL
jgi:hypothetical protein